MKLINRLLNIFKHKKDIQNVFLERFKSSDESLSLENLKLTNSIKENKE